MFRLQNCLATAPAPGPGCSHTCMAAASCCVSAHAECVMMLSRRVGLTSGATLSVAPREDQNLVSRVVREQVR